jgi:hypothetical protein
MTRVRPSPPIEGGWYSVPLPDGSFALLVVTFFDGETFAGFYFGPAVRSIDDLKKRAGVKPGEAVLVALTEPSGIASGRWRPVGRRTEDVESWEIPEFIRREGSTDEYLVRVEPREYAWYVSRRRRPVDDSDHRRDWFGFNHSDGVESNLAERLRSVESMPD